MTPLTLFNQKKTKIDRLLAHFKDGGNITTFEAYTKFGITQLGRSISDLEKKGHSFNRPKVLVNGIEVCRYSLIKD